MSDNDINRMKTLDATLNTTRIYIATHFTVPIGAASGKSAAIVGGATWQNWLASNLSGPSLAWHTTGAPQFLRSWVQSAMAEDAVPGPVIRRKILDYAAGTLTVDVSTGLTVTALQYNLTRLAAVAGFSSWESWVDANVPDDATRQWILSGAPLQARQWIWETARI